PPERVTATFLAERITSWGTAGFSSAEKSAARTADFAASSATGTGHTTGSTAGATGGTDDGVCIPSKSEESTPPAACGGDSGTPCGCADTRGEAGGGVCTSGRAGTIGGVSSSDSGTLRDITGGASGGLGRGAAAAGTPGSV